MFCDGVNPIHLMESIANGVASQVSSIGYGTLKEYYLVPDQVVANLELSSETILKILKANGWLLTLAMITICYAGTIEVMDEATPKTN